VRFTYCSGFQRTVPPAYIRGDGKPYRTLSGLMSAGSAASRAACRLYIRKKSGVTSQRLSVLSGTRRTLIHTPIPYEEYSGQLYAFESIVLCDLRDRSGKKSEQQTSGARFKFYMQNNKFAHSWQK
jgi:hypothetical protein